MLLRIGCTGSSKEKPWSITSLLLLLLVPLLLLLVLVQLVGVFIVVVLALLSAAVLVLVLVLVLVSIIQSLPLLQVLSVLAPLTLLRKQQPRSNSKYPLPCLARTLRDTWVGG
mgnify:CR=1 FL=1